MCMHMCMRMSLHRPSTQPAMIDRSSMTSSKHDMYGATNVFMDMCVAMFIDMCVAICIDMCVAICIDMCVAMCIDMCTATA